MGHFWSTFFDDILNIYILHNGLAVRRQMAMRVPNGTICEIVIYKINCTTHVYIMCTFLYFRI